MSKDPAFLFYPGDYLRDTQNLSEKSQVSYDRIMCEHMRNICISQQQLKFFTKRLSDDEKEELMLMLTKKNSGYQIEWIAESIEKRRAYSESRRQNRSSTPKKDVLTYDTHMENEDVNEDTSKSEYSEEVKDCFEQCLKYFPEQLYPKKPNTWLETIDKLQRIDKVPFDKIVEITSLTRKDDFWSKNFLSLTKLRKKNGDDIPYIVVFNEQLKKNGQINQSEVEYWLEYYSSGSNA